MLAVPAFTCMDKSITYAELEKASAAFGAFLQSRGLKPGARVAIMSPNVLQYPVAMMGILRAGYTVVNVNPLYTPRELEHQLKDSGAEAIVIIENFAHTLQQVIAKTPVKHVIVASMGDMLGLKGYLVNYVVRNVKKMVPAWNIPGHIKFPAALKSGASSTLKPSQATLDDVAFLQYTGGTTGVSKGATLLHKNILSNVAQNILWQETAFVKRPRPDRMIFVCPLPLYHIYALTVNALMGMMQGAQNILIPNPRDMPAFVKDLQKYPVNVFPGLNTLFVGLMNNEEFRKLDFKPLYLTFAGGMAAQRPVAERWFKLTGIPISEGYGLSETSPVATTNRFDITEFSGTIGLPIPSTELAIRDDDGENVALGEVGEICIRGPQVMAGYWNRPDETAKGHDVRRLLQDRRHGHHGREWLHQDRRPQEGHDHRLRLQRLSERTGRSGGRHAWRARSRGHRHSGREVGRSAKTVHRQEGRGADRKGRHRLLPQEPDGLQGAACSRVPHRAAEVAGWQDPAQGSARLIDLI
jgi:long-chain acyl-CoA synthetase